MENENMEMETKVAEEEIESDQVPAEEAKTKKVDVSGLCELGLMIVGGVTVAKKAIKFGLRLGDKIVTKIKAKKEEKKESALAEAPAPVPVPSGEGNNSNA